MSASATAGARCCVLCIMFEFGLAFCAERRNLLFEPYATAFSALYHGPGSTSGEKTLFENSLKLIANFKNAMYTRRPDKQTNFRFACNNLGRSADEADFMDAVYLLNGALDLDLDVSAAYDGTCPEPEVEQAPKQQDDQPEQEPQIDQQNKLFHILWNKINGAD